MQQISLFPTISAADAEPMTEVDGRALIEPLGAVIWSQGRAALTAANASAAAAAAHGNTHTGRTFGQMLTEFVWQRMSDHFAGLAACHVIETRKLIRIEDCAYLKLRSLREDGLPWPPASETSCRITRQVPAEVPELMDLPVLTVGYRLRTTREEFSYINLLCLRDEKQWWWQAPIMDAEVAPAANDLHMLEESAAAGQNEQRQRRSRYAKKVVAADQEASNDDR